MPVCFIGIRGFYVVGMAGTGVGFFMGLCQFVIGHTGAWLVSV
jgi:hypothetical protein